MKQRFAFAFGHAAVGSYFPNGVQIVVPPDESMPGILRAQPQVGSDGVRQFLFVVGCFGGVASGNAVSQFLQGEGILGLLPFAPVAVAQQVDGDAPGQLGQVCRENTGPVGRHGAPGSKIGVIDTFPAVLVVGEDVVGNFG